jgi:hypothetical protein
MICTLAIPDSLTGCGRGQKLREDGTSGRSDEGPVR